LFHGSISKNTMNFMTDVKNAQERPRVEPVWDRSQPARDEMSPRGISGELRGISGGDWLLYGAVPAVALGIGVVNALSVAQDVAWRGGAFDVRTPLFREMSSIVVIVLVAPILFVAVRRMRHASGWLLRLALAVAAIVAFSTLHIAGMVGLRKIVMYLVGGSYDFRFSAAALIYEFRKDLITCLLIGGSLWLIDSRRETQQSHLVAAAAPPDPPSGAPHLVWLRDGSTRIRIEPSDILWVGSSANYVEYSLADGRSHLVRGTLAAEEARLARFNIVRVHRTRLVNLARVNGLRPGPNGDFELTLDTGQVVPGSRRYRDAVTSIKALAANAPSATGGSQAHP
jgi:hypothetical protein